MNSMGILLSTASGSAVIAVILYISTYLAFLRLLKYPRNWWQLNVSTVIATSALAVSTVVFVSVSPEGADIELMAFLTGFIIVLFGIIATPAIDFLPGNRPVVEFFAKYGDHAGLWMLVPAIVAAYVFPSSKLHSVLIAAIVIELAWYLRNKWNKARQLYPLTEHDLRVLETQANGDIEKFARQNGIRELKLSAADVEWYGCSKNTLPCAFNLYTNRLGLNTAPCCREHMKDLAYFVSSCLTDMGAIHWLEGGTLLGAVRENGNLLAWEDDVDISFLIDDQSSWSSVVKGISDRGKRDGYFVEVNEHAAYLGISYDRPQPWPFRWERYRMRGEIRLDLVAYRRAVSHGQSVLERQAYKGALPMTESGWYGMPEDIVLPTSTIRFLDDDIPCPNQPQTYLRNLYSDYQKVELTYINSEAAEARRSADEIPLT
jgi:lipopolysaccharide cholinephosphotransferase